MYGVDVMGRGEGRSEAADSDYSHSHVIGPKLGLVPLLRRGGLCGCLTLHQPGERCHVPVPKLPCGWWSVCPRVCGADPCCVWVTGTFGGCPGRAVAAAQPPAPAFLLAARAVTAVSSGRTSPKLPPELCKAI